MFKIKTLKNGARLVLAPRTGSEAVTLLVVFSVGSRQETEEISGVSHFIEHLYFKGTTKRPSTLIISQELDKIGAEYNAFTGKDYTGYYIKVAKDKVLVAFDVLSDMLWHSLFASQEINRERGTIIEEIRMYKDNPAMYIDDLLEQVVYQGHELGRDIIGTEKVISQVSRRQILNYRDSHYFSQNMIIGVAGNFSTAQVNKLLDRHFSKPLGRSAKSTTNNFFKEDSISPRVKLHYKNVSQAQLAMGFVGAAGTDPNYWPQVILQIVLGGGMSSRLFVKVRERLGLAYVIRSSIRGHQDNSLFSIEAGLKKDKIDLAYKTIIAELKSLTKEKICQAELAKAKDYLQGKMALAFEESSEYIFWLLEQYINDGEVKTFAAVKEKINKVTAAEVRLAAQSLFKPEKLNLAIIGPYKDSLYFNKLINRYKL